MKLYKVDFHVDMKKFYISRGIILACFNEIVKMSKLLTLNSTRIIGWSITETTQVGKRTVDRLWTYLC